MKNIVFALKSAASAIDYRNLFESRRSAYGQSLVLLNSTSHDEETYDDPFQALVRYTVCGTIDGAPMIFYGQELGLARTFGFNRYEFNFGKMIPHFKKYNSLQPLFNPDQPQLRWISSIPCTPPSARPASPAELCEVLIVISSIKPAEVPNPTFFFYRKIRASERLSELLRRRICLCESGSQ